MLRHGGKDVERKPVGLGHVAGDELNPAIHQAGDKSDVARQPIQAGDDQHRPFAGSKIERGGELGPVDLPAALDLGELGRDLAPAGGIGGDGGALRV
jgi:hypothetical protein